MHLLRNKSLKGGFASLCIGCGLTPQTHSETARNMIALQLPTLHKETLQNEKGASQKQLLQRKQGMPTSIAKSKDPN
eukprot:6205226-Amphidinium_carterae.1